MKKFLAAAAVSATLAASACTSVDTYKVNGNDISTAGGAQAVATITGTAFGISLILNIIDIIPANMDVVVNQLLVKEAKSLGASKVEIVTAGQTPKGTLPFMLAGIIIGFPAAQATGIAVK